MTITDAQVAKIREQIASLPDALKRDVLTNYREGYFFVTLNTRDEAPILSTCVGVVGGKGTDAPRCVYTEVGEGVLSAWSKMSDVCPTVELIACEAMPEHFHGLLHLLPGNRRHLGSLISGFLAGCSHAYWDTLGIEWRKNRDEKVWAMTNGGKSAYALLTSDRDRDHTHSFIGPALFVHGYNDVEPITDEQVQVKIDYIRKQAEKRLIQGDRHECFRKYRHQHAQSWNEHRCIEAIASDRCFCHDIARCETATDHISKRLNRDERGLCLDYIGNRTLLGIGACPTTHRLPLICHSADAARFDEQKEAVLQAARDGAVIVSAFISPKERDIRRQLMVEQLPCIEILDNGFPERYKPYGQAFYACGENRLLQITCWQYEYQKDGSSLSREMCLVMNELARVICGEKDDWWKTLAYSKK